MQTEFVYDFGCQNHTFQPRKVKFCLQHPNTKENKMQLTKDSYFPGVSTGSMTRPVMFYCGDCKETMGNIYFKQIIIHAKRK
jgi:hypothetical protein